MSPKLSILAAVLLLFVFRRPSTADELTADVVVAGGSAAAMTAAFSAAEDGARTILIEPTDWIGGQFTSSGVPPVDEAWHKIRDNSTGDTLLDVAAIARTPENINPRLNQILEGIGNPGRGWVSRFCYEPKIILENHFQPWEKRLAKNLTVLRNTVIKDVQIRGRQVLSIRAIRRFPIHLPYDGYDRLPSADVADWYDADPSDRFKKQVLSISGAVFIEATEWGEILALSRSEFLQGVDKAEGSLEGNDGCGQSIVYGFVQQLHEQPTPDWAPQTSAPNLGWGKYTDRADAWEKIWTYRRLKSSQPRPTAGDLSLQNWGYEPGPDDGGNDYPFGYLFVSKEELAKQRADWQGGVDLKVLAAAEKRAYAWHQWYAKHAPEDVGRDRITLNRDAMGTGHGLSKLPYIRDTRRSIGIGDFVLKITDLTGQPGDKTGTRFDDRIAIGAYPADVHFLAACQYPEHVREHIDTRPFYIPFRALTHRDFDNLLVAGKTMAQSFMANSATRLHPTEWSTGTAAGTVAAWMSREQKSSQQAFDQISELRRVIQEKTPTEWTIPRSGESHRQSRGVGGAN